MQFGDPDFVTDRASNIIEVVRCDEALQVHLDGSSRSFDVSCVYEQVYLGCRLHCRECYLATVEQSLLALLPI